MLECRERQSLFISSLRQHQRSAPYLGSALHFMCRFCSEIPSSPSSITRTHTHTHAQKACHHKFQCFCAFAETGAAHCIKNRTTQKKMRANKRRDWRTHIASAPSRTTKKIHPPVCVVRGAGAHHRPNLPF